MSQAIENIASVSGENSAAVQEVSAASEEMSAQAIDVMASAQTLAGMAQTLQQLVAQFHLGAVRAQPAALRSGRMPASTKKPPALRPGLRAGDQR